MSLASIENHRRIARATMSHQAWDYIDGGSGHELTRAANRAAFSRVRLLPRTLVDVSGPDTRTDLLGASLAAPIGVAPVAYQKLAHPDGEVAGAAGAGRAGALFVAPMLASRTIEDVAAAATGPLWLQLYWLRRREAIAALADRAAAAGYRALVLTVDTPVLGRRRRDEHNGFTLPDDVHAVNLDPAVTDRMHQQHAGESALAAHAAQEFDPTLSWADLDWLRRHSTLPLVLKGILTGADATRAVDCGAAAVIVSNHGGRQLDRAPASLAALPEVAGAVGGRCPVLLDGGVRDGGDVFAALALGADAVLLGRPVLWALAAGGRDAVAGMLDDLRTDLAHTMRLAGRPHLTDIGPDAAVLSSMDALGRAGHR